DQINATLNGHRKNLFRKIRRRADHDPSVQSEITTAIQLLFCSGTSEHAIAERLSQLERGEADSGANGMNEQRLVRFQPALNEDRIVRGDERFGNCGCFGETQILRYPGEEAMIDLQPVSLCLACRYPE